MPSWTRSGTREGVWDCKESGQAAMDVSEVAFVDDMLSFLVYDADDEEELWATRVIECFEIFEMKANVSKLEILVAVLCRRSKPITRQVARGRLMFCFRGITIKATKAAKHLGAKIDVGASAQKEENAGVQTASQSFTIASRNRWKSRTLRERYKTRAFRTLVLPLFMYGTACLLLTQQQVAKLERWQTKQLWKTVRIRAVFWGQTPSIRRRLALWQSVLTP